MTCGHPSPWQADFETSHCMMQIQMEIKNTLKWLAATLAVAFLCSLGLALAGVAVYGSVPLAIAALRGQSIGVDEHIKSFGEAAANQSTQVRFVLTNLKNRRVNVIGATYACSCTISETKIPFDIAPMSRKEVLISIRPPSRTPLVDQRILLYTDQPNQPEVVLRVTGSVKSNSMFVNGKL